MPKARARFCKFSGVRRKRTSFQAASGCREKALIPRAPPPSTAVGFSPGAARGGSTPNFPRTLEPG